MITFNLKDLIDFAVENQDIYNVYFQKEINMLGVLVFIYHKEKNEVDYNDFNLNQIHKYMNGIVIQSLPSGTYKLLICPEENKNNFIYVYKHENNDIITNHTDNNFDEEIRMSISNLKKYTNFKFEINQNNSLSLVKYY